MPTKGLKIKIHDRARPALSRFQAIWPKCGTQQSLANDELFKPPSRCFGIVYREYIYTSDVRYSHSALANSPRPKETASGFDNQS